MNSMKKDLQDKKKEINWLNAELLNNKSLAPSNKQDILFNEKVLGKYWKCTRNFISKT